MPTNGSLGDEIHVYTASIEKRRLGHYQSGRDFVLRTFDSGHGFDRLEYTLQKCAGEYLRPFEETPVGTFVAFRSAKAAEQ